MIKINPLVMVGGVNLLATLLVLFIPTYQTQPNRDKLFSLYEITVGGMYGVYQLNNRKQQISISEGEPEGGEADEV